MSANKTPIVSIIIPVFNGAKYIREAVESVLNQTFKDFEIIVVDDGSTDGTFTLLEPWIKDGAIRYVHQSNKGGAIARNVGIRLAKGEFFKFLDSDDSLYPQQLEFQVQHLTNKPDFLISITDFEFEFENKTRKYIKIWSGKSSSLARFIQNNIGPPHCFLIRRSMIEKIGGFDEGLSSCQDSDLWLRVMAEGGAVERLDYLGCRYRILNGSVSSNPDRQLRNSCKVFEKLNQILLPRLSQLPEDVPGQLLLTNTKLIHMCFMRKIKPVTFLPTALKVNRILYAKKTNKLRNLLLKIIGIQNITLLNYIKTSITEKNYHSKLDITAWRNEQNYT